MGYRADGFPVYVERIFAAGGVRVGGDSAGGMNLFVWDFGVDAVAGEKSPAIQNKKQN